MIGVDDKIEEERVITVLLRRTEPHPDFMA